MQNPNSARSKRQRHDDDSDQESNAHQTTNSNFPRFLIIESENPSKPLSKLSPFVIERVITGIASTPKSIKKLSSGNLLVEVESPAHAKNLLSLKTFFEIPAKCTPHKTLNSSRGVIRCSDLADDSDEDIVKELRKKGEPVSKVTRIYVKRNNEKRKTNTFIVNFETSILPKSLKVAYMRVPVSVYIPNPLQCYNCFKFGHHESKCRSTLPSKLCRKCAQPGCSVDTCTNEACCANCGENHFSTSRLCRSWKIEKEILTEKYTQNISFPDARKIVEARHTAPLFSSLFKTTKVAVQDKEVQTDMVSEIKPTQSQQISQQKSDKTSPDDSHNRSKTPAIQQRNSPRTKIDIKPKPSPADSKSKTPLPDPKGSVKLSNRFEGLPEDMEADDTPGVVGSRRSRSPIHPP